MISLNIYQGKKVGVFGLGKAGQAAVAALLAGGAEVFADDDKQGAGLRGQGSGGQEGSAGARPSPERGEATVYCGVQELRERSALAGATGKEHGAEALNINYTEWPWPELTALVLSPGVPLTHPAPHGVVLAARAAGCPIIGEVELLQQACPQAIKVGITGTNGKSTTTALIGHILSLAGKSPQVGGNLGIPALALEPLGAEGVYVLEMSSFQLDLMHTVRFDVAVWLNITPDHLDRHGSMEGYIAAKQHIFERQQTGDCAIIGIDDAYSEAVARAVIAQQTATVTALTVGGKAAQGVEVHAGILTDRRDGASIDLRPCKGLKGAHNWQNAAAAFAACRALGVAPEIISDALLSFSGLAHRMEWVLAEKGVTFINDSKATNADSTAKALAAYPENIYWILGGRPKAGGISSLGQFFPRIRHAYLLGEAEAEFAATLEGHVPYTRCGTLEVATREASADALRAGAGVVLLSPACASWDQWPNFEVRGEAFKHYVQTLAKQQPEAAA